MTQAIPGYWAEALISTDAAETFNKIAELREVTLHVERDMIEATSHDSGEWNEYTPGRGDWTASAEALYVMADATQDAVFNALVNRQVLKLKLHPKPGSGNPKYEGDCYVQSWELSGPNDDAAAVSIEIQGTGSLTPGTQQ